jgi:hypothetical protein
VRETWRCIGWPGDCDDFREIIQYKDMTGREIGHEGDNTLVFENWRERMAWQGKGDLEKVGVRFDSFGRTLSEGAYDYDNPPMRWRPPSPHAAMGVSHHTGPSNHPSGASAGHH